MLFGFLFAAILTAGDPVPSAPPPSDWAFAKELAEMPAKLPPRVAECARNLPDGVTLQYNFESGATREQVGKPRRGGDFNNGGTKWIWPKRPEFPEPRLEQSRLTGDNFARLQVKGAEAAESPLADLSFDVPKVKPCKELSADGLKGLWIESEKWKGRPTHVFAYLALPEGASAANRIPGIVLAHGGGGTAYPNWARTWANKGYAAIVVDTCGYLPISKPTEGRVLSGVGGPAGWGRFELGLEKPCDQWPYHAVAALVRAHSYLRALPEVDAEKTGITGISWGGYLTMLAAATDRRYKFAMPVYACADFAAIDRECPFFTASRKLAKSGALERWDELFDAKHYAPKMDLPVFWFASSNDAAFPFDLLQRTVRMPKVMPGLAVRVNMRHSHGPHGENMPELFRFADSVVRGAPELPRVDEPVVRAGGITVAFDPKGWEIARVDLNWCKDEVPAKGSVWQTERHPAPKGSRFEAAVPAGAKWLYVNVVLKGETGEKVYPESLVSSPAVRL